MSGVDATVRWTLAVVLFAAAIGLHESPVMTFGCALVAIVLAGTAATRHCPFYSMFHLRTNRWNARHKRERAAH
ncbi:MAG TPA: DUF2892 domain-containing protein [Gemmatimonadales bacterium]|nr:DUF2892 domain-containing protein [Gemmatimonadales bacterium]